MSIAMPTLPKTFVRTVSTFAIVGGVAALIIHLVHTQVNPARGYTSVGLLLGILSAVGFFVALAYAWRKGSGQERLGGRLDAWLWVHVMVSVSAVALALMHAGFDLTGRSGTWTLLLFTVVIASGLVGWWRYRTLPTQVAERTGNLAAEATQRELDATSRQISEIEAGRSKEFAELARILRNTGTLPNTAKLPSHEAAALAQLLDLLREQRELEQRLREQLALKQRLRGWLWVHIPASLLLVPVLAFHIVDALDVPHMVSAPRPADFASPEECASCHAKQYSEWIASMHAIAQSSPVTDLQTRLVLELENSGATGKTAAKFPVGDFCEKCHAPTGTVASPTEAQYPLIDVEKRAPASMFGVSCVTCHQMTFDGKPRGTQHPYRNNLGQEWETGRRYFGPFGGDGEKPSIGNDYHRGEADARMREPEFCATCHTVTVDEPDGSTRFALQNTYVEWKGLPSESLQWQAQQPQINCMTCHSTDLALVLQRVQELQINRVALMERRAVVRSYLEEHQDKLPRHTAAIDDGSHDAPLPLRGRYQHTFTGVDYHLEPDLPYPRSHPSNSSNAEIRKQNLDRVAKLLQMSAAVRIAGIPDPSSIDIEVLNLATGHHFPAGFAFAREAWFEIAWSPNLSGDDWRVLEGGRNERPLRPTEHLEKCDPGTRNFQAVLYDSVNRLETVLQNETDGVLKTREQFKVPSSCGSIGFIDREEFLKPGEIRTIRVPVSGDFTQAKRARVRMLFRNLPPEFMEQLARRFRELPAPDEARAKRSEDLIKGLCIFEIAQDVMSVDRDAKNELQAPSYTCERS